MDNAGSDMRSRHVDLLTQQRRLRHLRSVALRNISSRTPDDSVEASKLETFFSLYSIKTHQAFYTSEKIKGSLVRKGDLALATDLSKLVIPTSTSETKDFQCRLNPTWKSFNLGQLDEELVNTAGCSFIIRVFRGTVDKYNMVIEWMVNLFGLLYLGKKLQTDEGTYQPNTLIFALPDGFYGAPLKQDEPLVLDDVSKSLIKVDQSSVRESYGTNSLSRIQTVLRAIKQTQASVKRVRSSIEDELSHSFILTRKKREREMLMLRVNQMRSDLEWRTMQLQSEKENREQQQARNHQRDVQLRNKFDTLRKDKHRLHEKKKSYFDVREDLIKTGAQLVMRRKQLISELAHIYPINDLPSGEYTICCVRLPNSEDFSGHDEIMIAVALGYTCHLVEMISCFLDVPLRYRMEHRGSRSQIHDHILDKLTEKDRDFPLYSKGKERFQFSYGVYLLNKNIAQLRYYCGLGTTDLRLTLPNLKTLLELRLGVKFQSTNSLLSGHHVAIPPNFGGPQKYNTSFQSASQPVKSKNVSQHGTTDRDSSVGPGSSSGDSDRKEVSQFEQVLNQTKETHRNTEQINRSIEESAISNIPIQHPTKVALEEDIFKGSPDSFFGVESVENVAQRILELSEKKNRESTSEIGPGKLIGLVFEKGSKTEESKSATDTSSDLNSSPIGDPFPLNHKISGSLNHDTEVSSSVDEANYESKFKMWPTAKDHAAIPRTDSSDMLEDFPIERAVRKSVCEDDYENMNAESSTFKTYAMTHQKEDGEESMVQLNSSPQRCSVEVVAEKKENSADVDKQNDSFNDSLATFSLANNKSVSVIENNVDS